MTTKSIKQGQSAMKLRLAKTMESFFKARAEEKCILLNGVLPPKQERLMQSIIKQAVVIQASEQP